MGYPYDWEAGKDRREDEATKEAIERHRAYVTGYLAERGIIGYSLGEGTVFHQRPIHVCFLDPYEEVPNQVVIFTGEEVVPTKSITTEVEHTPNNGLRYNLVISKDDTNPLSMTITCDSIGNIERVK